MRPYMFTSQGNFPPNQMSLFDLLLAADSPRTAASLAKETNRPVSEIEEELAKLLSENTIRKRIFQLPDGKSESVYWSSTQITFSDEQPIITSPFTQPFDHQRALERLSDAQLQQEKSWLQTRLRKVDSELRHLQHMAKTKIDADGEARLDALSEKWMNAIHEMLWDLLSKAKQNNPEMTMSKMLRELRIEPETVGWNNVEEDFA